MIEWKDPAFEVAIRKALEEPTGDIHVSQVENIHSLIILGNAHTAVDSNLFGYGMSVLGKKIDYFYSVYDDSNTEHVYTERGNITSLEDILHFKSLENLVVVANHISDPSPILQLSNLTYVNLNFNDISNPEIIPVYQDEYNEMQFLEIGDDSGEKRL